MPDENTNVPLPAHAYIPGSSPRHPEGFFDNLRSSVRPGMSAETLSGTSAFRSGLRFLKAGYFWEAHEVLEPVWMALPPDTPERYLVQALIQLANAKLKARMNRPRAAIRLCQLTRGLLHKVDAETCMSVSLHLLWRDIDRLEAEVANIE